MKHLKLFEAFNEYDELYYRIGTTEYRDLKERIIDLGDDLSEIREFIKSLDGPVQRKFGIPVRSEWKVNVVDNIIKATIDIDKSSKKNIEIFKLDDDWFAVRLTIINVYMKGAENDYFRCDELEGLKKLLMNL